MHTINRHQTSKFIIILVFFSLITISAGLIHAQTQTESETEETEATQSANPETVQNLSERVNKIVEEQKQEVLGELYQEDITKRGFVGSIQRVSEESLTVQNNKGSQIISISEQVRLIKNDEAIELSDIAIDEQAIVMGVEIDDSFQPLEIIVSEENIIPKSQLVLIGSIASIETNNITILSRESQQEIEIDLDNQTQFQDADGDLINATDLFEALQVIVVAHIEEEESTAETANEAAESEAQKKALIIKSLAPILEE